MTSPPRYATRVGACVWRRFAWLSLIIVMVMITVTPASAQASTPDLAASDFGPVRARDAYRLAFLTPYPDDPFWQTVQTAIEERAVADAVTVDVVALTSPSAPEQIAQMTEAIARGYDGILLGAVDAEGIVPGIVAANDAGIPVLAIETAPVGGQIVNLVRIDDVAAARAAGRFIAEAIDEAGVVLNLQGSAADDVAQDRDQGVRTALEPFPAIDVVSERAEWDRDLATSLVSQRLPAPAAGTPAPIGRGPRAIFAANDAMALGALDAAKISGLDTIVIVGFGGSPEALTSIAAGELTATVTRLPARVGAIGVDLMVRHLNGETVPPRIDPGYVLVAANNVAQFIA